MRNCQHIFRKKWSSSSILLKKQHTFSNFSFDISEEKCKFARKFE